MKSLALAVLLLLSSCELFGVTTTAAGEQKTASLPTTNGAASTEVQLNSDKLTTSALMDISYNSSTTAENIILVLLLTIAMGILISLIVLKCKKCQNCMCRNYRQKKQETNDGTSDISPIKKDQVTLLSVKPTYMEAGEESFLSSCGQNDAVENGKTEEPDQALDVCLAKFYSLTHCTLKQILSQESDANGNPSPCFRAFKPNY
ncbi:uncharacterized protein LOC121849543 isoform X2 [Callorhinchus milii]|uniref:uncharacterized protein LOC121849543 isoform X2 n=1 Tax=Callorhinchus milii TaxID=7868 RepID=UPI001C3FDE07|nr:uncharacterized protein LOC121849543 isoform X2 [Callorhinchus milii]